MQTTKRSFKTLSTAAFSVTVLFLLAWISPGTMYQMVSENDFIRTLKKKLSTYNEQMPEDRVYLQCDKPLYEPGDNIWFSAYVRDGVTLKPSGKSDIIHVELLNPKGTIEKSINIIAKNGVAAGDFSLADNGLGGMYKIRAYTAWMKNLGENNVFEKPLQVQEVVLPNLKMKLDFERKAFGPGDEVVAKLELNTNENKPLSNYKIMYVANLDGKQFLSKGDATDENGLQYLRFSLPKDLKTNDGLLNIMISYNGSTESISRSIPIVLNKIKLQLFPEGGDLVTALQSRVAFRALNEFGKPADVEGVVVDSKGRQVASFNSFHMGMGNFEFTPQANEKYTAKITKPENIAETFALPEALPRGYTMNVAAANEEVVLNVNSTETEELSLIAQVRNKIYYNTVINAKKGNNKIAFPTSAFPSGVAQITLFDSKGIARAERLAFVNKDRQLDIAVETEKEKYLPREKVKMTISVKDERGMPMPANLSMAVVNDQLLSFADDKSGNILSELLLQQDLQDKVEEPAFYFDKKEPKAAAALDDLLMTSGWRHFTWEKVMSNDVPAITHANERALVAGTVLDANTGKIIPNAKIRIAGGAEYATDENGKFIFNKLDLTQPVSLAYSATDYPEQTMQVQSYNPAMQLYLYGKNYYNTVTTADAEMFDAAPALEEAVVVNAAPPVQKSAATFSAVKDKTIVNKKAERAGAGENRWEEEPLRMMHERPAGNAQLEAPKQEVAANAADDRSGFFMEQKAQQARGRKLFLEAAPQTVYYRARTFAAPVYDKEENVDTRTDFRNTIYWNPNVEVDRSGKKTIEFYTSDDITSFRTTVEGIGSDGSVGRTEKNFFTQLPFAMSAKVPVEVATQDRVSIPLTLKNNTGKPLGGFLTVESPEGLKNLAEIPSVQTIMPGAAKTIYLDYNVLDKIGYGDFTLTFRSCGLKDAFTQKIRIAPKGFPVKASFSGQEREKEYSFTMANVVNGSVKATFTAFPNVVSDLMKGVEGILQEPYGCFEQTSCTAYPNAMVLDYLNNTDQKDNQVMARATDLLDRGYKRLTTFEASQKGYEWFGANPGHEGLTAYGIMEFTDMKNAGGAVDQQMLDRTAEWLLSHRDGKGGFKREQHAYHDFGRISDDILNAYIVYALVESGYTTNIKNEFETSYKKAMDTKDPYMLAMLANAAYSMKEMTKADAAMNALTGTQAKDGSFTGSTHSITYSQGQSLTIETTSLAVMAMLKEQGAHAAEMSNAVKYIVGARSGSGTFSSTQGTILALKALTQYAKFSKRTTEDGVIELYVDDEKVAEKAYKAGEKGAIEIAGLENYLQKEGKHTVKVKYVGVKNPLPYAVALDWNTSLPNSDEACSIGLQTKMAAQSANVGETVRFTATITNKRSTDVPSTMAIIGIPAGFTVQPWQLKELQEKNVFDYYEIKGNNIAVYYRGMGPSAVKEINLDLKAEMPGTYDAPASSAYLYYTNEFKTWSATEKVTINKKS